MSTNTELIARLKSSLSPNKLDKEIQEAFAALEAEVERLTKHAAQCDEYLLAMGKERDAFRDERNRLNQLWGDAQAQLAAAQGQIPRDDISLALLERLSKTLTRLGYATPEGGMEHFNAVLPHQLYSLCRGIDIVLDKLDAPIPQQPAPSVPDLDSRDFYEVMQAYRHCPVDAAKPFEAVKAWLRNPTYPYAAAPQPKEKQ